MCASTFSLLLAEFERSKQPPIDPELTELATNFAP